MIGTKEILIQAEYERDKVYKELLNAEEELIQEEAIIDEKIFRNKEKEKELGIKNERDRKSYLIKETQKLRKKRDELKRKNRHRENILKIHLTTAPDGCIKTN